MVLLKGRLLKELFEPEQTVFLQLFFGNMRKSKQINNTFYKQFGKSTKQTMCHHVLTESQRCHQGAFWHGLEIGRHVTIGRTSYLHHCVICKAQSEDLPQACRVSPQKRDVFKNYREGKKNPDLLHS